MLVLLHSKRVSHGVTQLGGRAPSLPPSVCLFPLRSPFLDKRMLKDGGAAIPWTAVLPWWSSSQDT